MHDQPTHLRLSSVFTRGWSVSGCQTKQTLCVHTICWLWKDSEVGYCLPEAAICVGVAIAFVASVGHTLGLMLQPNLPFAGLLQYVGYRNRRYCYGIE
jgi:hypothetical protein